MCINLASCVLAQGLYYFKLFRCIYFLQFFYENKHWSHRFTKVALILLSRFWCPSLLFVAMIKTFREILNESSHFCALILTRREVILNISQLSMIISVGFSSSLINLRNLFSILSFLSVLNMNSLKKFFNFEHLWDNYMVISLSTNIFN